jgi:hypothetical protein
MARFGVALLLPNWAEFVNCSAKKLGNRRDKEPAKALSIDGFEPGLALAQGVSLGFEHGLEQVGQHGFVARQNIHLGRHAGDDGQFLAEIGL